MDLKIDLTASDRAGIANVFDSMKGVDLDAATNLRAARKALALSELGQMTIADLRNQATAKPQAYTIERGLLIWTRNKIEEAFKEKNVSSLVSDFVLTAYEAVRATLEAAPNPKD